MRAVRVRDRLAVLAARHGVQLRLLRRAQETALEEALEEAVQIGRRGDHAGRQAALLVDVDRSARAGGHVPGHVRAWDPHRAARRGGALHLQRHQDAPADLLREGVAGDVLDELAGHAVTEGVVLLLGPGREPRTGPRAARWPERLLDDLVEGEEVEAALDDLVRGRHGRGAVEVLRQAAGVVEQLPYGDGLKGLRQQPRHVVLHCLVEVHPALGGELQQDDRLHGLGAVSYTHL